MWKKVKHTFGEKKIFPLFILYVLFTQCNSQKEKTITFYKVPLVCSADKEIACGSRIKPFFIETGKQNAIKESWVNREGTVIAIIWKENIPKEEKEKIILPLFEEFDIEAKYISNEEKQKQFTEDFFSNLAPA